MYFHVLGFARDETTGVIEDFYIFNFIIYIFNGIEERASFVGLLKKWSIKTLSVADNPKFRSPEGA